MNILVTGSNGQLGNEMRIVSLGSKNRYIFTDVVEESAESVAMLHKLAGEGVDINTVKLDITDIDAIRKMVRENDVKAIVNCAAYTNVDAAERNQDLAELLNAKAPQNIASVMAEVGGLLIHISTDYVFGKEPYNTPCREDQKGTPTGVYGLTKLHGEQNIMTSGCDYIIIRTAWLYSEFGKNFVKTMLNLTATKPELKVVFDQVGTPTYAGDLAGVIFKILEEKKYNGNGGIYHYSNEGVCSWYDFAKLIAEYSGHTECNILPCHSDEFPSPVKRPAYSVLDKTKIKNTFGLSVFFWAQSLNRCITNFINTPIV
jgi:dTDP-4-dehydrorhamnose reductase